MFVFDGILFYISVIVCSNRTTSSSLTKNSPYIFDFKRPRIKMLLNENMKFFFSPKMNENRKINTFRIFVFRTRHILRFLARCAVNREHNTTRPDIFWRFLYIFRKKVNGIVVVPWPFILFPSALFQSYCCFDRPIKKQSCCTRHYFRFHRAKNKKKHSVSAKL